MSGHDYVMEIEQRLFNRRRAATMSEILNVQKLILGVMIICLFCCSSMNRIFAAVINILLVWVSSS